MPNGTQLRHKAAGFPPSPSWHDLVQPPVRVEPRPTPAWVPNVRPHAARPGPAEVRKSVKYSANPNVMPRRELRVVRRANGVLGVFHGALVSRSPKAAPVPGAAVGMAKIRAHRNASRDEERTAKELGLTRPQAKALAGRLFGFPR